MKRKFEHLSDRELVESLKQEVKREKASTVLIIEQLEETEIRILYSKYHYSSLWEFAVKELGYDTGSAQRRINAMRISKQVPEVKEGLKSATLCLSTVSMVEQFTKNERKNKNKSYSPAEKRDLINQVAHKSARETQSILKAISPESAVPKERLRAINGDLIQVSFTADKEALKLAVVQKKKSMDFKSDTLTKAQAIKTKQNSHVGVYGKRVYISVHKRRAAFQKAANQCTFISPITGKRCESKHQLEIEHIMPLAKGGNDDLSNLTVLCRSHNFFNAAKVFGEKHMQSYRAQQ